MKLQLIIMHYVFIFKSASMPIPDREDPMIDSKELKYYFPPPEAIAASPFEVADTLHFVHIMYRHGDRTPSSFLPNEPNNALETWPEGSGELTKKGMQQQYRLGKYLRKRYDKFLGPQYSRQDIYVRSSDYSRTLMSAQANLAGMFPKEHIDQWDKTIDWFPIPIHTVDKENDIQLNEQISCPAAESALDELNFDPKVHEIEAAHKNLLEYISRNLKMDKPLRLRQMWSVFDPLNCIYHHKDTHAWPTWMNDTMFERIRQIYHESSQFSFHNEKLRRLRGGSLVIEVLDRLEKKISGELETKGPRKMYVYSAHDTTLAAYLSTMGIVPHVFPLYASAVFTEMHLVNGKHIIRVFTKNVTDEDSLYEFIIPNCSPNCELETLKVQLKQYFPIDWFVECGRPRYQIPVLFWGILALLVFSHVFCCICFGTEFLLKRRRKMQHRTSLKNSVEQKLMSDDEDDLDLAIL